jgi:hypothetical protein
MPFFLRHNTALSGFLRVYRQGLLRMSFDNGLVDLSIALVPGSGGGVTLMNGYPVDIGRASNRIYRAGKAADSRIFFTRGDSVVSLNPADNSIRTLSGQGPSWIIPHNAAGMAAAGWVVSERGRVTLVDGDLEAAQGFPVLTGHRLSSPPSAHEDKLYLCGDDERVYVIDTQGNESVWETSFSAALRSPPSFLSIQARGGVRHYAAVYPKSFFGEIWLLDLAGKALPNWPASVSNDEWGGASGIGFGSPLLFAHNNSVRVAFVSQEGELSLFDESAAFLPGFPLILDGIFYQQPVFDGDYLWLVSDNGTLFRVSIEGEVLYQRIPGFSVKEEGYLAVFNSDSVSKNGDKAPAIFITGEGNALHGYSRNFRSLEGFPLPMWGMPVFIMSSENKTGNGKAEIIGMGMDYRLYRWQFK